MSERIRWAKDTTGHPGYENIPEWTGTVRDIYLFLITRQALDGDDYTLSTRLPWQHKRHARDLNPDLLKAEAERWLEEFVTSLGAIFGDTLREAVTSERAFNDEVAAEHAEYGRESKSERCYGWVEALDWTLARMDRMEGA